MKKIIVCAFMLIALGCQAQSKVFDLDKIKKAPKTETELIENATLTKDAAIYKGKTFPVYRTSNGKLFIILRSETSKNLYRKYFKETV